MGVVKSRAQRGFTLVEVMITVIIIAILAAIVVPRFTKESNKSKARSEVAAMFAEIQNKEEIYKSEISTTQTYGALAACGTPGPTQKITYVDSTGAKSGCGAATDFTTLGLSAPESSLMCTYTVYAGASGTNPNTTSGLPAAITGNASFSSYLTNPTENYYVVWATCDTDNDSTNNSYYVSSSLDSTIQKINEGY